MPPLPDERAVAPLESHGCTVEVVCVRDHPLRFVDGISKIYPYRGLNSVQSLYEAIVSSQPDIVVPCDDSVVWQLHELHHTRVELQDLIERSLGGPEAYEIVAGQVGA